MIDAGVTCIQGCFVILAPSFNIMRSLEIDGYNRGWVLCFTFHICARLDDFFMENLDFNNYHMLRNDTLIS